ncbi:MAG: hypothetical protein Q9170_007624 [Blastenia crenularia]
MPDMAPSESSEPMENPQPGPHPSYIQIAKPYIFESKIQECLLVAGVTETRDDSIRLQAVLWIDSDAAAAALFTACKIEDTLKKSRDILSAAHNSKTPVDQQLTPDDPFFENHAKIVIGVERLMLEASGFDFRNRYPQRLLLKIARSLNVGKETVGKTAYGMSLDLYRTFAPLKQTTPTMAIACVELAGRVLDSPISELEKGTGYEQWKTSRQEIMETLLDLLDLYTHHRASTIVGQDHAVEKFISIRIALNQEASAESLPRFAQSLGTKALVNGATSNGVKGQRGQKGLTSPRDIVSPKDVQSPQPMGLTSVTGTPVQGRPGLKDGTVRFMLDPERAQVEKHTVAEFFKMDEESYEVEVESNRRRASVISMTTEEASTDDSQSMDLESQDNAIHDSVSESCIGRKSRLKSISVCEYVDSEPQISNQQIEISMTEQATVAQFPPQEPEEGMASIRGGDSGMYIDQENPSKPPLNDENAHTRPRLSCQKIKVPLADQGAAFQAALQQSQAAPPSIGQGKSADWVRIKAVREAAAAAVAENPRVAALKRQRDREKKARRREKKKRQQEGETGLE